VGCTMRKKDKLYLDLKIVDGLLDPNIEFVGVPTHVLRRMKRLAKKIQGKDWYRGTSVVDLSDYVLEALKDLK